MTGITGQGLYEQKRHPEYFSTARQEVGELFERRNARVMEVGCGEGKTLRFLKEKGYASWTCGVDAYAPALAEAARAGADQVVQGNIEDMQLRIDPNSLDVILCLDVLEHLIDPWSVVKRLHGYLKSGGLFIASIPNVQNLRVMFQLAMGRWQYGDTGILDMSHLRFFTRSTALGLVEQGGFHIDRCIPILESHPLPRYVNLLTFGIFGRFVTVQFLVRGVKS